MHSILVIILTLLLVPVVLLTNGALRIVLGVPFILFLPGYSLMAALFPKKGDLDIIERIGLSFGLSIAIVSSIVLILNYTPWGITLDPILICVTLFIVFASFLALYRRRIIPAEQRFEPHLRIRFPNWGGQSKLDKALLGVLIISIVAGITAIAYAVATTEVEEEYTEFYIVGSGGMGEDYPQELALGEEGTIILAIINHEHQATDYSIEIKIDGEKVQEISHVSLAHEEKLEEPVTLVPSKAGEDQKVEFLLYKNDETELYRRLLLWLDVKGVE